MILQTFQLPEHFPNHLGVLYKDEDHPDRAHLRYLRIDPTANTDVIILDESENDPKDLNACYKLYATAQKWADANKIQIWSY